MARRARRRRIRHPAEHGGRGRFEHLAEQTSFAASTPAFFAVCVAVTLAWLIGFAAGASDSYKSVTAGLMSAFTLLLVALVKNAELRAELAVQKKLDAIAEALLAQQSGRDGSAVESLEQAIGVHERL